MARARDRAAAAQGSGSGSGSTAAASTASGSSSKALSAQAHAGTNGKGRRQAGGASSPAMLVNKEQMQRMNYLHQASMLVASAVAVAHTEQMGSTALRRMTAPSAATLSSDPRTAMAQLGDRLAAILRATETQGLGDELRSYIAEWKARGDIMKANFLRDIETRSPQDAVAQIAALHSSLEKSEAALLEHRSRRTLASARWIKHRVPIGEVLPTDLPNPNDSTKETPAVAPLNPGGGFKALVPGRDRNLSTVYGSDLRSVARKSVLRIDPSIKRSICRNCDSVLIPGVTSSVRILPSRPHVHVKRTQCLQCGITRTIPCPPVLHAEVSDATLAAECSTAALQTQSGGGSGKGKSARKRARMEPSPKDTSARPPAQLGDPTPAAAEVHSSNDGEIQTPMQVDEAQRDTAAESDRLLGVATNSVADDAAATLPPVASRLERPTRSQRRRHSRIARKASSEVVRDSAVQRLPASDSVVPGTPRQYCEPVFHERPEHVAVS